MSEDPEVQEQQLEDEPLEFSEIGQEEAVGEEPEVASAPKEEEAKPTYEELLADRDAAVRARDGVTSELARERKAAQRFEKLYEGLQQFVPQQQPAQPEQPPDPEEDPAGFMRYQADRVERSALTIEQQRAAEEANRIYAHAHDDMQRRVHEEPDFEQAAEHYIQSTFKVYEAHYPGLTDEQFRSQVLPKLRVQTILEARQRGVRVSDVIAERAQKLGWQRQVAAGEANGAAKPNGSGQPAIAGSAARKPAKSLSAAGGPGSVKTKSLREALASMSDEEYEVWYEAQAQKLGGSEKVQSYLKSQGIGGVA